MTKNHEADQASEHLGQRKLLLRMAVALGLIAILLAGLFLFESGEAPPPTSPPSKAALPQVVMGQVQSVAQSELQKPPTAPETTEAAGAPPVPAVTGETAPEAPKPPLALGSGKPVPIRVQPPASPASQAPAALAPTSPTEKTAAPLAPTPPSAPTAATQGYLLQVDGFSSVAEAEAIRAKLQAAGIPSVIEARVRIGPYPSRNAAAAARTQVHALGLDASLVMPPKK
jgi:DedD protein